MVTQKIHMVDLIGQFRDIEEEVTEGIQNVMQTAAFINGPEVKKFGYEIDFLLTDPIKHEMIHLSFR